MMTKHACIPTVTFHVQRLPFVSTPRVIQTCVSNSLFSNNVYANVTFDAILVLCVFT